jgi:3-oxoacyl-[acyl-carrier protein] reductase
MDLGLKDHAYLVTGAGRGLGHATAQVLVDEGAKVVISSRSHAIVETARELSETSAVGIPADNADPTTAARLVTAAKDSFGRIDGALISVGGPPPGSVLSTSDDAWRAAFEGVFLGAVRLARTLAADMADAGSLVFVLSTSVRQPIGGLAISNGLRPGLAMVAKTLADELGPNGIRVNGLMPGRVATERVRELDALSGDADRERAQSSQNIPLRRYGEPEEFGRGAAFLLSPAASYLTGVMIPVDGGITRAL